MRLIVASLFRASFAVSLVIATPVGAAEAEPWRPVTTETAKIRDIDGLEQLARDFPDSGTIRLRLLQPYFDAGEYEKVMAILEWLYDRGYVFSEVAQQQIPKLLEGVDPGRIAERLRADAEVIATSKISARVPAEARLVESVLPDPESDLIAVTSVIDRSVWLMGPTGDWQVISPEGVGNLSGIAFDEVDRRVWVAAGHIDGSGDENGSFTGLIAISLYGSDELRVPAPDGVSLSDTHATPDGSIYASDPVNGGIYVKMPGAEELDTLVGPGTFQSPQGLATSEDGTLLYISDYRYGLAAIELGTGQIHRIAAEGPIILDGIDGLWRYKNELIAVQNGTSPMRISAFRLSGDGLSVLGHRILEQANPDWTEPLSGNIANGSLRYVGNGQWDRYVAGQPAQDKPPLPTQIRTLLLD